MGLSWPWVKPAAAPTDALAEQHAGAVAEHEAAQEALAAAESAFAETGDDKAAKAMFAAKERLALAEAHLHRAEKLLTERREKERQEELTRLRGEVAALRSKSAAALEEERPLIDREVELLAEVVAIRERRWRVRMGANAWVRDINHLLLQMGEPPEERLVDVQPSAAPIVNGLKRAIRLEATEHDTGRRDPRGPLISHTMPTDDDYRLDGWRGELVYPLAELPPITPKFEVKNL